MSDATQPAHHAWRPERFLVIVAHPDDADFGPAGTA
jgi:LmbE family N-acetylglucosaminyl deacetylase